ncbi:BZ3500_MvSof-1268-A1-R1_Chr1-3g02426 [Microbotryum saponariae]|uniref:BZ3500_MvSof-1268-A1-R1_Chr1-3g02426 protein n=1 Tax=Microbotryum saponariae TaxID=289078 RepID=A0A2X0L5I8_9BASI|nr:BZ3500_MvSof-1268-A1-R1_Chr1-3g02426 [Microbotryum saponariae]SCZ96213.1 BZ3501_MvSof-1269-A2-R1_Chr1-3g02029 [Microbotryum saponariae]
MKCNIGYKAFHGTCVAIIAPACTKKSIAFYDNFQTSKNGEPAVTVT